MSALLDFRFGFLCYRKGANEPSGVDDTWTAVRQSWAEHRIGEFVLWIHPSLPIMRRSSERQEIVVLGDAFSFDHRPLAAVADDFQRDDPWPVLDELGGRFAVLVISGDRCRVAHDAFGSRSIFYVAGEGFAVASHTALLAHVYNFGRSKTIAKYMQKPEFRRRTVKYLPGDRTIYDQIYALAPNNYLDSRGNRAHRYWPVSELRRIGIDDFYREVDRYFAAFIPFVVSRYLPIFGITGGVDSRAVFAAFRRYGVRFRGLTWHASNLGRAEKLVIDEIVVRLGLDHLYVDPKEYPSSEIGVYAGRASGNFRGDSSLSEAIAALFGSLPCAAFVRGYGGEIMRGFYNLRAKPIQDFRAESLVHAYGSSLRRTRPSDEYKASCASTFDEFRLRANYAGLEAFGYDPNDIFYWEHRMGMWASAKLNEMDPALYSLVGFNSRPLFAASFGLAAEQRLSKDLLKGIVRRNDDLLASLPYA